ncbi:hypothetical protein ACQP2F_44790 [Actinoplanes sp. CA-030573]|uniref:hypothetical protein n=1 Tax=Actinoplanes sp. CA-030573 TaxID=3239898 RepID=UPI003D904B40
MTQPAAAAPRPPLELTLAEARTRFVQLVRLAGLTRQATVVTDAGRPAAAIVPIDVLRQSGRRQTVDGWLRRIEKVREDLRAEHAALQHALGEAWARLDEVRPPGADPDVDALRASHADLRRPP